MIRNWGRKVGLRRKIVSVSREATQSIVVAFTVLASTLRETFILFSYLGLRRLPARYAAIVLPLVLSLIMTFVVSGISTARSAGLSPSFVATWMSAWGLSWLVAFPVLLAVMPVVRRIVGLIVETRPG